MRISICDRKWWLIGIVATTCGEILFGNSATAQIVPDKTLGAERSVVTPNVTIKGLPSDRIDGGAIRGADLFHSFQEFNVKEGRGAYFSNPAGIENILTRVTGTNASNIFGKLGVLGNANLFLLNPNGIIFGPNASLDINGSFVGSTANSLNFGDGKLFSATNPTAPPLLTVKVPLGVQFPKEQPRAIVNSGNLSAGTGQNLTLLGGTVVSTGQLSAPGGQVAVAAVPSGSIVQLSSSGQLLNIDVPSPEVSVGSSASLTPLLASNDGTAYPGLTVNGNGQVELLRSGLPVVDGDVVARNVTAQSATLTANHNLTLVESQLGTSGDLNLLAGDTVRVRDSVTNPFVAQAGGQLLVQGKQGVDIFALNHPSSGLVSGGDLVLRSLNTVGGDAHYWAGGNFRIEKLDGSLGGLFSPYDPIIRASGDVSFDSYKGGSLHILAGGSVIINGTVEITGADGTNGLVQPGVPLSRSLPDGTSSVDINGRVSPTLDIRAGTTAFGSVGLTPNPIPGIDPPSFSVNPANVPTNANIQIGSIINEKPNAQVFLTNQYQPNSLPGSIQIGPLNNQLYSVSTVGSPVTIDARGDVKITQGIITGRSQGTGGNINILSVGDIDILKGNNGFQAGLSSVVNDNQTTSLNNQAGNITLISTDGTINTQGKIDSFSSSGEGGNIILHAKDDITIGNEIASLILNGAGKAGNIQIISDTGNINLVVEEETPTITQALNSAELIRGITSSTPNRTGGNVLLNALNGSITTTGWTVTAESKNGVAGNVTLSAGKDINSGNILASSNSSSANPAFSTISLNSSQGSVFLNRVQLTTTNTGSDYAGNIEINAAKNIEITGRGNTSKSETILSNGYFGTITIEAGDNVSIKDSILTAQALKKLPEPTNKKNSQAGDIEVTSRNGKIDINNSSLITSTLSPFATAGNITLTANQGNISINDNSDIRSRVFDENAATEVGESDSTPTITLTGNSVNVIDSTVTTSTFSSLANAGNISVVAGSVLLSGSGFTDFRKVDTPGKGLLAQATENGGTAGNIFILTDELKVKDGAAVTVRSPKGQGGSLVILAKKIFLNNGALLATTGQENNKPGDGSNIILLGLGNEPTPEEALNNLKKDINSLGSLIEGGQLGSQGKKSLPGSPLDFLHLGNESLIETNAKNSANGGNIAIKTQLLLALPPTGEYGSDISANAEKKGRGGVIAIDTRPLGTYGIEFRPNNTSLNDITATSETGPAGIVSIRLPDVDPRRGLFQLPEDLRDSSRFIDPSCPVGSKRARSRFVVTGRGGLPPNPGSALNSDILLGGSGAIATPPDNNFPTPIVEAQGVEIGPKGEIILAANPSKLTSSYRPWQPFTRGCYGK